MLFKNPMQRHFPAEYADSVLSLHIKLWLTYGQSVIWLTLPLLATGEFVDNSLFVCVCSLENTAKLIFIVGEKTQQLKCKFMVKLSV